MKEEEPGQLGHLCLKSILKDLAVHFLDILWYPGPAAWCGGSAAGKLVGREGAGNSRKTVLVNTIFSEVGLI